MAAALISISSAREDLILVVPGAVPRLFVRHPVADCWHNIYCIQIDHAFHQSALISCRKRCRAYDLPFLSLAVWTSRRLATDTLLAAKPPSDLVSPADARQYFEVHDIAKQCPSSSFAL